LTDISLLLSKVPLFSFLDEHEREVLAARLDRQEFKKGVRLFAKGDPGDRMYVLISGEVEISLTSDTGDKVVLEQPGVGEFFGEISLLDGGPRTAAAIASDDSVVLVVDRSDLDEFFKMRPAAALDLLTSLGKRLRETNKLLRGTVARNINRVEEDNRTAVMKVADWISDFSGSLPFLFIHCGIFFVWIVLNAGPLAKPPLGGFDPYPFGLLTMVVSLEAIILSVFVLLSQNRQVTRDRMRNDVEYAVNVRAELEVAHLHDKLDDLREALSARLEKIERAGNGAQKHGAPPAPRADEPIQ
jgi:uncharacterized membrane protein